MTENKYCYSKMENDVYSIEIKSRVSIFNSQLDIVNNEKEAKIMVNSLNDFYKTNKALMEENRKLRDMLNWKGGIKYTTDEYGNMIIQGW